METLPESDRARESLELILFLIRGQEYCIDIKRVLEIRGWSPATPVAWAPEHVHGVINLRGKVIAVVDLGALLGAPITEPGARNVIIVAMLGDQRVGLLVDAVSETLCVETSQIHATPRAATPADHAGRGALGFLTLGERMVSVIDLDRYQSDAVLHEAA